MMIKKCQLLDKEAIYILLSDKKIYNSSGIKSKLLGSGEVDSMRSLLQKYIQYGNSIKDEKSKHLSFVSREYVEDEIQNTIIQYKKF